MKTKPSYILEHSLLTREVFIHIYTSTWKISKTHELRRVQAHLVPQTRNLTGVI